MKRFLASLVSGLAISTAVSAQVPDDIVRAELLPGWRGENGMHYAGLRITLRPGWKTYWRAPGDAGIPPLFDWSGSLNMEGADVHYPRPSLFDQAGITTIGYADEVIFPFLVKAASPDEPITLTARVELGVCEDICVPVTLAVSGILPAKGGADADLTAAMQSRPATGLPVSCDVAAISDGVTFAATSQGNPDHVVIEAGSPGIWVSEATVSREGGTYTASADMVPPEGAPFALDRSQVRVTVFSDGEVSETVGCD